MDSLKTWAWAVCSASLALAAFRGLLPEKSVSRAAKLAAALWFVIIVISPIKGWADDAGELSLDIDKTTLITDSESESELVAAEAGRLAGLELTKELERIGVAFEEASVSVNISPEGGIYCDSVHIELPEQNARAEALARNAALELTGCEPSIGWG